MSAKVKLEEVTGEKAARIEKVLLAADTVSKAPELVLSEEAHVDDFSGKAAVGVMAAGGAAILYAVFAFVAIVAGGIQAGLANLTVSLIMAACCFLMLKKSRLAAVAAATIYALLFATSILIKIYGGSIGFDLTLILSGAILYGLWQGIEGISDYQLHQKSMQEPAAERSAHAVQSVEEIFE